MEKSCSWSKVVPLHKKGIGGAIPFFSIFHNFSILIILQYEISNEDQLSMVKASLGLLFCDVCPHLQWLIPLSASDSKGEHFLFPPASQMSGICMDAHEKQGVKRGSGRPA